MTVFDKLNLKDHSRILVVNGPDTFEPEISALKNVTVVRKVTDATDLSFSLAFVTKQKEIDTLAPALAKKLKGDAVVWFAYPKGSSKKYKSEINRDSGWKALGEAGFEPVRMVAIDEDWSALRFRRAEFIKTMKRGVEHRMSEAGKTKK
jgi:hypothetical protein